MTTMHEPHIVVIEFDCDVFPQLRLRCEAGPTAMCRAHYDCDCEEWTEGGNDNGTPWHQAIGYDEGERHEGRFEPGWCNVAEWFDEGGGGASLSGSVDARVSAAWNGHGFDYNIVASGGVA